jgi:8-oxo-dGTP pyrophosphatase MutT (NUDIX family)
MMPRDPHETRQDAAVLVPLFRDEHGALRLVLVRRAEGGVHGGQLAFPGGKPEPADVSAEATAMREACEETGLVPEAIEILATLPILETRTTGFRIAPFLARIRPPSRWVPQANEIVEVLEVPVDDLMRPEAHGETIESFPTWPEPRRISFYRVGPHRLWGASYRIFHPLLPRIVAGEWKL